LYASAASTGTGQETITSVFLHRTRNGGIWLISDRQDKSSEPSSGSALETVTVTGYRLRVQELAGIWPEPKAGNGVTILLPESAGNPLDPIVSRRTSLTWVLKKIKNITVSIYL
jgi:hypothetical protein